MMILISISSKLTYNRVGSTDNNLISKRKRGWKTNSLWTTPYLILMRFNIILEVLDILSEICLQNAFFLKVLIECLLKMVYLVNQFVSFCLDFIVLLQKKFRTNYFACMSFEMTQYISEHLVDRCKTYVRWLCRN